MVCDMVGSMQQEGRGSMLAVGEWGRGGWGGEHTWFSCETRTCILAWGGILGTGRCTKRVFASVGKGSYSVKGMLLFVEAEGLKLKSSKWSSNTKGNIKIPKWDMALVLNMQVSTNGRAWNFQNIWSIGAEMSKVRGKQLCKPFCLLGPFMKGRWQPSWMLVSAQC